MAGEDGADAEEIPAAPPAEGVAPGGDAEVEPDMDDGYAFSEELPTTAPKGPELRSAEIQTEDQAGTEADKMADHTFTYPGPNDWVWRPNSGTGEGGVATSILDPIDRDDPDGPLRQLFRGTHFQTVFARGYMEDPCAVSDEHGQPTISEAVLRRKLNTLERSEAIPRGSALRGFDAALKAAGLSQRQDGAEVCVTEKEFLGIVKYLRSWRAPKHPGTAPVLYRSMVEPAHAPYRVEVAAATGSKAPFAFDSAAMTSGGALQALASSPRHRREAGTTPAAVERFSVGLRRLAGPKGASARHSARAGHLRDLDDFEACATMAPKGPRPANDGKPFRRGPSQLTAAATFGLVGPSFVGVEDPVNTSRSLWGGGTLAAPVNVQHTGFDTASDQIKAILKQYRTADIRQAGGGGGRIPDRQALPGYPDALLLPVLTHIVKD